MEENTPTPSSNNSAVYVAMAIVAIVVLAGGFMFRHQIKTALTGGGQPAPVTSPAPNTSTTIPSTSTGEMQNTPQPAGATVESVEVDYTSSGFSPATVTIKKGGTVRFVNKSGSSMDVASNPHPIHTDYPGFDQGKSDARGKDEYDFTFEKVGTWGYHNHLNPSDGGTVVVTE